MANFQNIFILSPSLTHTHRVLFYKSFYSLSVKVSGLSLYFWKFEYLKIARINVTWAISNFTECITEMDTNIRSQNKLLTNHKIHYKSKYSPRKDPNKPCFFTKCHYRSLPSCSHSYCLAVLNFLVLTPVPSDFWVGVWDGSLNSQDRLLAYSALMIFCQLSLWSICIKLVNKKRYLHCMSSK